MLLAAVWLAAGAVAQTTSDDAGPDAEDVEGGWFTVADGDTDVGDRLVGLPVPFLCGGFDQEYVLVLDFNITARAISGAARGQPAEAKGSCRAWPGVSAFDENGDAGVDGDEPLYLDLDASWTVSTGDLRINGPDAGSFVTQADHGLGVPLVETGLQPAYVERGPREFDPEDPWYLAAGHSVQAGDVRMAAGSEPVHAAPAGDPAGAVAAWGTGVLLALLVPLIDRFGGHNAGTVTLVASWATLALVTTVGGAVAMAAWSILAWQALAFALYRLRRGDRNLPGAPSTVHLVAMLVVHGDVASTTWRRDFWMRATSDEEAQEVQFMVDAHMGAYQGFFYRRYHVLLEPRLRYIPGDPGWLDRSGQESATNGPLSVALLLEEQASAGLRVVASAQAEFKGKPWKVLWKFKGLSVEGEVGADMGHHRMALGSYAW